MTHQELIDSAASYALDALESEERRAFEAHLADCRDCQTEVAAYREVATALAHAAPAAPGPSPALRERILREARQVRPIATVARDVAVPIASVRGRGRMGPWLVAAVSLAASIVVAFVARGEREQNQRLASELASTRETLARDDSTLSAFLGPEVHVVSLTAPSEQKPRLRVFWNHTRHTFIVTALGLQSPPEGKTYQLWAMRKGQAPISMGTFTPDPSGRTTTPLAVAQSITDGGFIDDCALTVEPAGGSAQPTEAPRLIGSWRHVD
jgi:anti-sigma-K factor RskA